MHKGHIGAFHLQEMESCILVNGLQPYLMCETPPQGSSHIFDGVGTGNQDHQLCPIYLLLILHSALCWLAALFYAV